NGARGDITYHYGPNGLLQSQDSPRGNYQDDTITDPFIRHEFVFDVLGHLYSVVYGANTAQPRSWHFERTAEGYPLTITDPLGRVTRLDYDERFLILRQTFFVGTPEQRTVNYSYDRNGNLTQQTDAAGR